MEGKLERSTTIEYHNKKNWERLIFEDDIMRQYYTVYNKNNRLCLRRIKLEDGSLGTENILYYPLVKKVLVRNGYAYFTYRQPGSIERTMLFRQKLKDENIMVSAVKNQ
jgi:hypothetical protein